ncbi:alpha-mannosidase At3g26720-like [Humulus lupulus]|uniref:alpha-mannosidase At3g26720-like n=1 Tax=Humulus lupulus TaxID=3486 RepID=UPI002B41077F|nr:alpha-mannosidase At3g26720-like [Humulus lupulus]
MVRGPIGPIPVDDNIGKEITTQITTALKTNGTFYTDSNRRDFIKRINLGIYMQDSISELSVLVDRSVGGSSLVDAQIELMLHRLM